MRKVRLDIDRLAVESFEVVAGATDPRGTIQGNAASPPTPACSGICSYYQSCVVTICGDSCPPEACISGIPTCPQFGC